MVLLSELLYCCFINTVLLAPMCFMTATMVAVLPAASNKATWCCIVQQLVHMILTGEFGGLAGLEWKAGCIGPNKVV